MAYPLITTYPPLNQLTVVPPGKDDIAFTLVVEWSHTRPPYPFEFSLAFDKASTSLHESQWRTTPLLKSQKKSLHVLNAEDCRRDAYSGSLSRHDLTAQARDSVSSSHYLFTVRFRVGAQSPWQWMSILDGAAPGELVIQDTTSSLGDSSAIAKYLELDQDWTISSLNDKRGANTSTFLLESKTVIAKLAETKLAVLPLTSIASAIRHFSVVRLEPYWIGPRQGKGSFFHVGEDAILVSFLLNDGLILTFIVLGWIDDVYQVFQNDEHGRLVVAAQNDNEDDKHYKVIMSAGLDFEDTVAAAMDHVRDIISSSAKVRELTKTTSSIISSMDVASAAKSAREWHDSVAFCTWNALGQDLTQTKILDALDQLEKNDIHISTLLIDDNWQTLGPIPQHDYSSPFFRGWADTEANTSVAPSGLADLIASIRSRYPTIKDIGVWHALMGYWGGISPTGKIANDYATSTIRALLMGNTSSNVTTIAQSALHTFYDDFYATLRAAGLTFVKTDVQHMLSMIQDPSARRDLIATYQSAWTSAHLKHFHGKAISCMSQTPQTLFHSLLQTETPPVVMRNSDDFYPEVPASHPWHVWVNAHNAVFSKHLNVVPDWDMFQTDHEFSAYHAAARCVSGGPILITDVPGKHDVRLIGEMTATTPGGVAVALRTGPGVTTDVFGLYTEENVLKVRADAGVGGVVMALFNVAQKEVRAMIHAKDFGLESVDDVLVRGHRTGEIFGPIRMSDPSSTAIKGGEGNAPDVQLARLIHTRLDSKSWDILTMQPIRHVQTTSEEDINICVLGLLGKMSGASAITASSVSVKDGQVVVSTSLKALGTLGVWFDRATKEGTVEVRVQGSKVEEAFLKLVTLPQNPSSGDNTAQDGLSENGDHAPDLAHVWEVDVEAYWKQKELWDESCSEVVVEVVVG